LDARSINAYYGTRYNPADLDTWRDVDIQEAIQYATLMEANN